MDHYVDRRKKNLYNPGKRSKVFIFMNPYRKNTVFFLIFLLEPERWTQKNEILINTKDIVARNFQFDQIFNFRTMKRFNLFVFYNK